MKVNSLASLRRETERLEYKLKVDKSKLKTDIRLLRFNIIEFVFKEFFGLFKKSSTKEKKVTSRKKETINKESPEKESPNKKSPDKETPNKK